MLAKSLAKAGSRKGGSPLERQGSAPQSMPTVRESASLRTDEDASESSDGGNAPLQPLDRRRSDVAQEQNGTAASGDGLQRPNGLPPIATSSSGSSELQPQQQQRRDSSSGSVSPPKPPDETDGFAGVAVSKPQVRLSRAACG